jgi:hypothetical protein
MERLGRSGIEVQGFLHRLVSRFEVAARKRRARLIQLMLDRVLRRSGIGGIERRKDQKPAAETEEYHNLKSAA